MHRRTVLAAAGLTAAGLLTTAGLALAAPAPVGPNTGACAQATAIVSQKADAANSADKDLTKATKAQKDAQGADDTTDKHAADAPPALDPEDVALSDANDSLGAAKREAAKAHDALDKAVAAQHDACGTKAEPTKAEPTKAEPTKTPAHADATTTVDLAGSPHAQVAKAPTGVNTGRA